MSAVAESAIEGPGKGIELLDGLETKLPRMALERLLRNTTEAFVVPLATAVAEA